MSTFESGRYRWRETYFLLFDRSQRPSLERIEKALGKLKGQFELQDPRADEDGGFESVSVVAPGAYSAMDISYVEGEEVLEQTAELAEEFAGIAASGDEEEKLKRMAVCDGRFDILHFEQIAEEDDEEMFDPSALLLVVEALSEITDGVAVDPQSGTVM